jgi:hypothetical protein
MAKTKTKDWAQILETLCVKQVATAANSNMSFQTINPPYLLLLGEADSLCCAKLGFFDTFDDTFSNNFKFEGNAFDTIIFQSADGRLFQNSEFLEEQAVPPLE